MQTHEGIFLHPSNKSVDYDVNFDTQEFANFCVSLLDLIQAIMKKN